MQSSFCDVVGILSSQMLEGKQEYTLSANKSEQSEILCLGKFYCIQNGNRLRHCKELVTSVLSALCSLFLQAQKEIEEKGEWKLPTKHNEEGYYSLTYDFIREAENHCVLNSPIPVTCPIRLIHGMKDSDVPWQISMQVADRVLSKDVDVILRKNGQHRMSEKEDTKLLVNTVDDLIDKLATLA